MAGNLQVISVDPEGNFYGLDHKRKGVDLRQFGTSKIQRVTLIEWNEDRQAWLINWTEAVCFPPQVWSVSLFIDAEVRWESHRGVAVSSGSGDDIIIFTDYEDAVSAEVAVIQALQLAGDTDGIFG